MFDMEGYLDLPENPCDCIYENYRNKALVNPVVLIRKFNHAAEMQYIHSLHISLYDKYGEDWVDSISFSDEKLRDAIKLLYIKDYPGKDVIITYKKQRKELYSRIRANTPANQND